mmetsp:Transcript_27972/g.41238  ORF Transcript_27972/g.41238 Transcript_27972/m.41238 type:complete len:263 (-) Transcript_27972:1440-2228(-)|eukprot:CAMPEP_0116015080 /NCGR_PEP_ID=MMETSP0321-20121206/6632_1 /TAXON_ID=163516 /ORGANISM="Leptocylindrus danicus var. danicus, Strain B650" /LENGTH=262 /DNA_ID=CAMNT_0003484799 /DNA_START=1032 /DNA_END=1820 /DNA_ORIENTATION=-
MVEDNDKKDAPERTIFVYNIWNYIKKKWSESRGPEAVGWALSKIPKETKDSLIKWSEHFFDPKNLRSFQLFFGTGEKCPFFIKRDFSHIRARVAHNLKFFYLNYVAIAVSIFSVAFVTSPAAIVFIFFLSAWTLALKLTEDGSLAIRGIVIPQQAVLLVLGIFTVFIVSEVLAALMSITAFFSATIAGSHALLRDETSLPAKIYQEDDLESDENACRESIDENSFLLSADYAEKPVGVLGDYIAVDREEKGIENDDHSKRDI